MTDFVTLATDQPLHGEALSDLAVQPPAGWSIEVLGPGWVLARSASRPLPTARRADGTILVGEYFGRETPSSDQRTTLTHLLDDGWGRYVALARSDQGLSALRDPSGGLDAAVWRRGGVEVAASCLPDWLAPWWPDELAINWSAMAAILQHGGLAIGSGDLLGLSALAPGAVWETGRLRQAWTPGAFARQRDRGRMASPADLALTVDAVVEKLARGPAFLEISGGLDSAIVAAAVRAAGSAIAGAVNYHVERPEGDERLYARAVARHCGLELTEVAKPETALCIEALRAVSGGLHPALDGVDTHHDADLAERCRAAGAATLLTGRGGDNVFFQTPTPAVLADAAREGLRLRDVADLARWQGRSVYGLARAALGLAIGEQPDNAVHPWLQGIEDLPPAKVLQIAALASGVATQSLGQRGRVCDLRHPLLAQPLMELCLAIPTPKLVRGGRDRGFAREAFHGRVHQLVLARRSKGRLSAHYGRVIARSLETVRPLLLEGRLAAAGLIPRTEWEGLLSADALMWQGGVGRIFTALMAELWVEAWEDRLKTRALLGASRESPTGRTMSEG